MAQGTRFAVQDPPIMPGILDDLGAPELAQRLANDFSRLDHHHPLGVSAPHDGLAHPIRLHAVTVGVIGQPSRRADPHGLLLVRLQGSRHPQQAGWLLPKDLRHRALYQLRMRLHGGQTAAAVP